MTGRLNRLFDPSSIAVVGGRHASMVVRQCERLGFDGAVVQVEDLAEMPEDVDAVFVGINRTATIEAVEAAAEAGAGGVVCFASGFAEIGTQGADLQAELLRAAGAMSVLGPNCHGFVNYLTGAALWPDQLGHSRSEGGVALITQSGFSAARNATESTRLDHAAAAASR